MIIHYYFDLCKWLLSFIIFEFCCLPNIGLQWRLPSQLVVTSDPLIRDVIPSTLLRECLNIDYLHTSVATILNTQMMHSLGVQTLNTQHLLEVGKTIVGRLSVTDNDDGMYDSDTSFDWSSSWNVWFLNPTNM